MLGLWETITTLIQQYTIADTASLFAIIEGLATVVAAVGAIIAVSVTRKIAKRQIEIAEKQNEISDKQANIAVTQNKIGLFERRYIVYDGLLECITHLKYLANRLNNPEEISITKNIIKENILRREGIIITRSDQLEEFTDSLCLEYYFKRSITDVKYIQQAGFIFNLNSENVTFLKYLTVGYSQLRCQIIEVLQNRKEMITFVDIEVELPDLIARAEDILAEELGDQLKVTKE